MQFELVRRCVMCSVCPWLCPDRQVEGGDRASGRPAAVHGGADAHPVASL